MKIKYEILVRLMRFVRLPQDVVEQIKEYEELKYWKRKEKVEKTLSNQHYFPIFTEMFGLGYEFYAGKSIVDIGCGPRGSLEWANNASSRVGYDPLAKEYLKLGGG